MNIKTLITTFALLGSSSIAMARPAAFSASASASWSFNTGRHTSAPVIRDHRGPDRQVDGYHGYESYDSTGCNEPMMFPNNNALTSDASIYKGPLPAARSSEGYGRDEYGFSMPRTWLALTAATRIDHGRQFITDIPDLGAFTTVRLQNVAGMTSIGAVLVRFANGEEQTVQVNQDLSRNNPVVEIRLKGGARILHGFVINGSSAYGSAYQVFAL